MAALFLILCLAAEPPAQLRQRQGRSKLVLRPYEYLCLFKEHLPSPCLLRILPPPPTAAPVVSACRSLPACLVAPGVPSRYALSRATAGSRS